MRPLRHREFRLLFLGQAPSVVGDRMTLVALAIFVTQLTHSAADLGIVLAAQSLPLVALLPVGGVLSDRFPRHRVMMLSDLSRALLQGLLAALILAGRARVWEIAVLQALYGAATAFFQPAYSGLLPQTVPEVMIGDARALTESAGNLARLVGPAIGTVLILGVGAGEAFVADAGSFLLSALFLIRMSPRARGAQVPVSRPLEQLREGWREVRARSWVWATILAFTGYVFLGYAMWNALAPGLSRRLYGAVSVFGWLETLAGVGAVAGALLAFAWRPRRPLRTGLALFMSWPLAAMSFVLAAPLPIVAGLVILANGAFALLMIWWETALAHHIPPHALSRVSAWDWMGSLALLPLGYALAGPLAAALGARWVLGGGSVAALGLLMCALLPRQTRELRASPGSSALSAPVPP